VREWGIYSASLSLLLSVSGEAAVEVTLDKAIERALENNKLVLVQKQEVERARGGVLESKAGLFPTLSISGTYSRLSDLPELQFATPLFDTLQFEVFDDGGTRIGYAYVPSIAGFRQNRFRLGQESNYVGKLSFRQPIFTWGRILHGYEIAKLNLSSVEEDLRRAKNEVEYEVTEAFYHVLFGENLLELAKESHAQIRRHLDMVERRYDAGLASRFDLLRAKVQLANRDPEVVRAENAVTMAKNSLKIALGIPCSEEVEVRGVLEYVAAETDLERALGIALAQRPEIRILGLRRSMAEKALAIVQSSNKPSLGFLANYTYGKPYMMEDQWGGNWDATLALEIPLFDGGITAGRTRQMKAQLHQAEVNLEMVRTAVEFEVRNVLLELGEAAALVESQKENVKQAEEALEIAEERYENGLLTSLEVMDTQLALAQAKTAYLEALCGYLIARSRLKKVVGGDDVDSRIDNGR